jgi:hypothetical protein
VRFDLVSLSSGEILSSAVTEPKPGEPYGGNLPMFHLAPAYRVQGAAGAPADGVSGLGLGSLAAPDRAALTSYGLRWQWTVAR